LNVTLARLKRLQRLEARRAPDKPWVDPFPVAMALFAAFEATLAAEKAGREFSRLPQPEPEFSPEVRHLVELRLRESDRIAERLRAERA
jgi:hypothetical protein